MSIYKKIKKHHEEKTYCTLFRNLDGNPTNVIRGYIVDYSKDFLVVQESDDFLQKGFKIFPIEMVAKVRHNRNDKYYDKIMRWEKVWDTINYEHRVNLASWTTIFNDLQKIGFNVIIEDEHPEEATFDIGPITEVTNKHVLVRYFSAAGILAASPTKFKWKHITCVTFDDRYINIFSKYLR